MKKRANIVLDSLLIIIVLFAMSIIAYLAYQSLYEINVDVQADPDVSNESKAMLQNTTTKAPATFDGIYVTVFALLWIMLLIGTYNIKTSPAFFGLFLIMFAIIVYVGMILANASDDIGDDSSITAYASAMPKTQYIIDHMAIIVVFIIATCAMTLWGKNVFDRGG